MLEGASYAPTLKAGIISLALTHQLWIALKKEKEKQKHEKSIS